MDQDLNQHEKKNDPYDLRPTNLKGVYTFAPPPKNFEASSASWSELRKHGMLLRRPDPISEPTLFAAWTRVVASLWRAEAFLPVRFEPQLGLTHVLHAPQRTEGSDTSERWCGCVIVGKWVGAFGTWRVPAVTAPPDAVGQALECASWIGLDGSELPGTGSNDVLQAGVSHDIDSTGRPSYTAWFEWYVPNSDAQLVAEYPYIFQTNINIPVRAGDQVAAAIQYVRTDTENVGNPVPPAGPYSYGAINFINVTAQKSHAFYMKPPPGAGEFAGDSAEWIMERGTAFLPKFGEITFDTVGSCSAGGTIVGQPVNGTTVTLVDGGGRAQTAENVTDTSVTIEDLFN